jgi:hypothetical protein
MTIPIYRLLEVGLYSILNFMPFLLLAIYPFRRHLRFSHPVTGLLIVGITLIQIGLGFIAAFGNISSEVMSLISPFLYAVFYFFVIKDTPGRLAFVLLVIANFGNLVSICAKCLEGMLFGSLALENYRWSMNLCMVIMHLLLTLPFTLFVRKYFVRSIPIHTKYWKYLWIIPATFYAIWYYHLYFAGHSSLEVAMDLKHAIFLAIINGGAIVVYNMAIALLLAQEENAKLTQNNYLLTLQNIQYENLQQRIDEARQARHDVRHHAHMTLEYLRGGKLSELEAYLEQYIDTLPNSQPFNYCQHYETNALLGYFVQQAQHHGITMDVLVRFPEAIALPETTLAVILGNLLENAVDACKEITTGEKKITVRGMVSDGFVYFDISNNYTGALSKAKNGNYLTTKKNGKGLGLQSVAHLVKLHDGVLEVETTDNVFRVSVMLRENANTPAQPEA